MNHQSSISYEPGATQSGTQTTVNIPGNERNLSMIGGALLLAAALLRRGWVGLGFGAAGATLLYQGSTGVSPLHRLLGKNRAVHDESAAISVPHEQGKHVSASIVVERPAADIYGFWRDFRNLSMFLPYLNSVEVTGPTRSHWSVKGPVGTKIEWDAEIINDEPNSVIGWRSLTNPFVDHAGSVRFNPMGDRSTEVRVQMEYLPIGGPAAVALVKLIGASPEQQITDSLRHLKELLESGEARPDIAGHMGAMEETTPGGTSSLNTDASEFASTTNPGASDALGQDLDYHETEPGFDLDSEDRGI